MVDRAQRVELNCNTGVCLSSINRIYKIKNKIKIRELNMKYRSLKFFGSGLSTSSGGILFILADSAGDPQNTNFIELIKGRSGLLSLEYGSQMINIINIYMPNNKLHQKETLRELRQKMENIQDINNKELLIVGDWNFVEDCIDRSPQHDDDHNVIREMTKLKTSFDLLDSWRESNPDARKFTWEGSSGCERRKIFSRIDRIYTSKNTWEPSNEYEILSCDFSDHDGISVIIRNASAPSTGKGEQKMNLNILNHPLFKKESNRLIHDLENQLKRYEKMETLRRGPERREELNHLRSRFNPQLIWNKYKNDLLKASATVTQKRRNEITHL